MIDDDWLEDGSDSAELNRERKARENEFHSVGERLRFRDVTYSALLSSFHSSED